MQGREDSSCCKWVRWVCFEFVCCLACALLLFVKDFCHLAAPTISAGRALQPCSTDQFCRARLAAPTNFEVCRNTTPAPTTPSPPSAKCFLAMGGRFTYVVLVVLLVWTAKETSSAHQKSLLLPSLLLPCLTCSAPKVSSCTKHETPSSLFHLPCQAGVIPPKAPQAATTQQQRQQQGEKQQRSTVPRHTKRTRACSLSRSAMQAKPAAQHWRICPQMGHQVALCAAPRLVLTAVPAAQ